MRARKLLIGTLAITLGYACTAGIQRHLDVMRIHDANERLLYLPNERLLNHFSAGMDSIIADFLWLKCVQYTAQHFRSDQQYTWLNHMAKMIVRLDPYNVAACRYLAMFLSSLKADDNAGIELLKRGMVNNPFAYELPYEIAVTYLLNRRDQPDTPVQAAKYLGMAVETGKAPPFVLEIAQALQGKHNLLDVERSMWLHVRDGDDAFMRELALRKLTEIDLRVACSQLDKALEMYRQRRGQPPQKIEDLVAGGILAEMPTDPLGGRFFIDRAGHAQNTSVLDEQVKRGRNDLSRAIETFHERFGRLPAALEELVSQHVMDELPPHPYLDRSWHYAPDTGTVD